VENKAVERDKGKIDIGTALAVAADMEVTEISAALVKDDVDIVAVGEARCECLARGICVVPCVT
jgi:hypothetical protein